MMTRSRPPGLRRSWFKLLPGLLLPALLVACVPPEKETVSETSTHTEAHTETVSQEATSGAAVQPPAEVSEAGTDHSSHAGHSDAASSVTASTGELALEVGEAAVTAVPASLTDTAAYVTLRNPGAEDVVLVGASSPAAEHAMLMETVSTESGGASMSGMVETQTLTVPAGGELKMASAGDHVMLMGLKEPLAEGDQIELTLQAEDGRTLSVTAEVQRP